MDKTEILISYSYINLDYLELITFQEYEIVRLPDQNNKNRLYLIGNGEQNINRLKYKYNSKDIFISLFNLGKSVDSLEGSFYDKLWERQNSAPIDLSMEESMHDNLKNWCIEYGLPYRQSHLDKTAIKVWDFKKKAVTLYRCFCLWDAIIKDDEKVAACAKKLNIDVGANYKDDENLKKGLANFVNRNIWPTELFFEFDARKKRYSLHPQDSRNAFTAAFMYLATQMISDIRNFKVSTGQLLLTEIETGELIRESGEIEVDGIRFPKTLVSLIDGEEVHRIEFDLIEVNPELNESLFTQPALPGLRKR